jgi:hypothetical protein
MQASLTKEHNMSEDFLLSYTSTGDGVIHDLETSPPNRPIMSHRRDLLMEAADLVDGDRNAQYGDPIDDFRRTAIYWSTHAGGVLRRKLHQHITPGVLDSNTLDTVLGMVDCLLDPHDVAIMMTQLKNSRLAWSPEKRDHWADSAGYSACGFDCVQREWQ